MSEEDSALSSVDIIYEKKFNIETDKENKMELFLRNYNNDEFGISIYNNNEYPSKKYELKWRAIDSENRIKLNGNVPINIIFEEFYDLIINIKSVKEIDKGWELKMNDKGIENYNKFKKQSVIRIGVIGNSNKGKSFILSKLSKIKLPSRASIRTEGLSVKYPEIKDNPNRKIVLLDSAGLETPVLVNEIDDLKKEEIENTKKSNISENNEQDSESEN